VLALQEVVEIRGRVDEASVEALHELLEAGKVTPVVDRTFACHAGGRGFESRRSRFTKYL
jgi:hypothetical protein